MALLVLVVIGVTFAWGPISIMMELRSAEIEHPFDVADWRPQGKSPPPGIGSPRYSMVQSLLASKQLAGRTRQQVVDLLGEPTLLNEDTIEESLE